MHGCLCKRPLGTEPQPPNVIGGGQITVRSVKPPDHLHLHSVSQLSVSHYTGVSQLSVSDCTDVSQLSVSDYTCASQLSVSDCTDVKGALSSPDPSPTAGAASALQLPAAAGCPAAPVTTLIARPGLKHRLGLEQHSGLGTALKHPLGRPLERPGLKDRLGTALG